MVQFLSFDMLFIHTFIITTLWQGHLLSCTLDRYLYFTSMRMLSRVTLTLFFASSVDINQNKRLSVTIRVWWEKKGPPLQCHNVSWKQVLTHKMWLSWSLTRMKSQHSFYKQVLIFTIKVIFTSIRYGRWRTHIDGELVDEEELYERLSTEVQRW